MAEVINLRLARKARDRARAAEAANEQRARYGQTRSQRVEQEMEAQRLARTVDGARRDRERDNP